MKTTNSVRVKMRKNDISEESKKKSVKLTPIKKNSKESKQFLKSDYDDEDDDFEYISKKQRSTNDYFDDGDEDFEDLDEDFEEDFDDDDYDEDQEYDEEDED